MERPEKTRALPAFYANAARGNRLCAFKDCSERSVRGTTVCPVHEHAWDTRADREQPWRDFIKGPAPNSLTSTPDKPEQPKESK